jgi:hypothetical protein
MTTLYKTEEDFLYSNVELMSEYAAKLQGRLDSVCDLLEEFAGYEQLTDAGKQLFDLLVEAAND